VRRPAKPAGSLAKQAVELKEQAVKAIRCADPAALRERLAFSEEHLDVLDQISSGLPVKNAVAILAAARMRLDFTLSRPAQGVALQQHVTFTFVDPYGDGPDAVIEVGCNPAALPLVAGESILDRAERVAREREAQVAAKKP
jgi:hypothetical protein